MTYNSQNDLLTFTDPNGNVTRRQYSASGQLLSQINPLGQQTRYEYDAEDRLVRVIDSLGRVTQLSYNAAGRLSSITNPLGETQTLETDAAGNLIKRFDAFNRLVTSVEYDSRNNPVSVTDAQSNTTTREFDPQNRLVKTTDPLSRVTSFEYDKLNRVVSSIDALMGESRQAFDTNGNRNLLQDPNGNETSFDFDQSSRLTQETLATGDKVKYTYSARDLLESITNGRGQIRQLEYDAAGRVTRFVDQDGAVSLSYDPNGNVLTVTDSSGTITRQYDSLNRVIRYTDQSGNTLQYLYNSVGELVTLIYPDNRQVTYEYDAASRLVKVIDWAGRTTTYQYDKNSRLTKTLRPNGTEQTRAYNAASQLTQLKEVNTTTGEIINRFDFSYDAAGNIVEEKTSPEADPDIDLEMIYAAANRLASYDTKTVQFDADGNMTLGPLSGQMANFVFDSRNRLTQAGDTVYRYNAENQRIGINQTQYVINSQPALSQVLVKKAVDGTETYYVHGLGLIGQEQNGEYQTYHFDYRGSTVALTDETGSVVERFLYSPYGLLLSGDASITPFLFNGMYGVMTDDNGLYYMRARYYSPEIRRFVNQDILLGDIFDGQTLNRYAFVIGQVIRYVDPWGLLPLSLERAVEIVELFLPELYNNYASPSWGNLQRDGNKFTAGQTDKTGKITIDESLSIFNKFPSVRKEIEQCGKLSPELENILKEGEVVLLLLETVIHEFMHSTLDNKFKEKHFFGQQYLWWDNFFYEMGIDGTWHSEIYQLSAKYADIIVDFMFLSDDNWYSFKEVWNTPE